MFDLPSYLKNLNKRNFKKVWNTNENKMKIWSKFALYVYCVVLLSPKTKNIEPMRYSWNNPFNLTEHPCLTTILNTGRIKGLVGAIAPRTPDKHILWSSRSFDTALFTISIYLLDVRIWAFLLLDIFEPLPSQSHRYQAIIFPVLFLILSYSTSQTAQSKRNGSLLLIPT